MDNAETVIKETPRMPAKAMNIFCYPDPVLREKCQPVTQFDADLKEFVESMLLTVKEHSGVGLAAPQVGLSEQIFVLFFGAEEEVSATLKEKALANEQGDICVVFINPTITPITEEKIVDREYCLSLPRISGHVGRYASVTVQAFDLDGNSFSVQLDGMEARVVQHEYDHLFGKLTIDHFSGIEQSIAENKLKLLRRDFERSHKAEAKKERKKNSKRAKRH